ncbi:MAG: Calx-beta domain-containing protein [Candidatus Marithrix sp.]
MFYKQIFYGLFLILLIPVVYSATVCTDGSCDYTNISDAITNAPAGDTITISAETYTESGLTIDKNLTITGAGSGSTIIQANENKGIATDRVFKITATATDVTIEKVTIRHGRIDIANDHGGGVANYGVLKLKNCTIIDNEATQSNGGGVFNDGSLTMNNCTVANNKALGNTSTTEGKGGGIQAGDKPSEKTEIINSTIYNNYAENVSGGLRNGGGQNVSINNTIIIGNEEGQNGSKVDSDCGNGNTITSNDFNLVGDGTGCITTVKVVAAADIDKVINTTLDTDGTHHLIPSAAGFINLAIHGGDNTCLNEDQVKTDRPNRGIACDIGAYEVPVPINPTDLDTTPTDSQINLTWTDNSNDETNFRIERSLNDSDWSSPDTFIVGEDVDEYNDTSLTCETTYYYRVYAYNTYGDSHYTELNDTTTVCPTSLTVTVEQYSTDDPTSASIVFKILFSSSVSDFTNDDVIISGTAGATTSTIMDMGNGVNYFVLIEDMTNDGTVIVNINASVAQDSSGNINTASTSIDNTVSYENNNSVFFGGTMLTPDIIDVNPDPTQNAVDTITIEFAEAITGFDINDLSLTHDSGSNLLTNETLISTDGGLNWTLSGLSSLTSTDGTYVLTLTGGISSDIQLLVIDPNVNVDINNSTETWVKNSSANTPTIFTVTTAKSGAGSGTVSGAGTYQEDNTVTLTANASSGSTFNGWSSGCSSSFTITDDITCTATFTKKTTSTTNNTTTPQPSTVNLTMRFSGFGSGTIKSSPSGINCNSQDEETCRATFDTATKVTLSYIADEGSEFRYWSGVLDCNDGELFLIKSTMCTVHFALLPTDLNIKITGKGTVINETNNINCSQNCTKTLNGNTKLTLIAEPKLGWVFDKWEGDCDATGKVTLNAEKQCTAIFIEGEPLQLHILKTGNGYVTSNPTGIDCGEDCVEEYANGLTIALTAVPDEGWEFEGWRGHCAETQTAIITESDRYCRAVFILPQTDIPPEDTTIITPIEQQVKLTITKIGEGVITAEGIQCGDICSKENYTVGSRLNLTATPADGWELWSWTGDCDANGNVILNEDKTCQALFGQSGLPSDLTVVKYGNGKIISQPDGINCGIDCNEAKYEFSSGDQITLNAIPDSDWQLEGWRGHCDDTGKVIIQENYTTCRAFFVRNPNTIPTYGEETIETVHGGQVTITQMNFLDSSSKVKLTATPESADYTLVGWENCEENTETIIVEPNIACKPIFALDNDHDGIADMVENTAPNNGDGNNDGILDSLQNNIISATTASGQYITTEINDDCPVNNVQLDSKTTIFALDCEQTTVTNYYHGINEIANQSKQNIASVNIQGQQVATETFKLTVDSSGKASHINSHFLGLVELSSSSYVARETDQIAKITVIRKNGCDGKITVNYNAQSEFATQNIDYLLNYGSLTWEDQDCSDKSFNITIFNDTLQEPTETVEIQLFNSEVNILSEAILTIFDDDSLLTKNEDSFNTAVNSNSSENTNEINVIDASEEQIIQLLIGQTNTFTIKEAMVFIQKLPDLQLVSVLDLKSFAENEGELTLIGLSSGETEITISNQDHSKETTVKIIVTDEFQTAKLETKELKFNPEVKGNIESNKSTTKCDTPNALAINSTGQSLDSDSCFISLLDDIEQSTKRKLKQNKSIRITSQIFVDPEDIGKKAEIILVVKYTDLQDKTALFNRGYKPWRVWDNQFTNLLVAQEHPLLPKIVNIFIFEGSLTLAGEFTVFVGYRLEDGTIVFNGLEPLNFLIEE